MSERKKLAMIGGGKMGEALVGGLLRSNWAAPEELAIVEPVASRRTYLTETFPGVAVVAAPVGAEGVLVAVKPQHVEEALRALPSPPRRLLSIAAGVTIAQLERWAGDGVPVVRAMPNTPALVGAGAAAIAPGRHAGPQDLAWAESILAAVGTVERVPESALDAVTGLSGSGPAYLFLVAEALIEGGVAAGLPRATAAALAVQTLLGASRLLAEGTDGPEVLRANVTSPGGTTAAGLRALEARAVRSAFIEAVMAATARSKELSEGAVVPTEVLSH